MGLTCVMSVTHSRVKEELEVLSPLKEACREGGGISS
jgi:hypothetical protein